MSNGIAEGYVNPYIDKDLDAALDSFDNLFCRRCLVRNKYYSIILFIYSLAGTNDLILSILSIMHDFLCILSYSPLHGRFLTVDYMDVLRILSVL